LAAPHLLAADSPSPVVFTDVTGQAGLGHAKNISGSPTNKQFLLEEMGCGVALFDYDNDGWLDIFLVNGTSLDPAVRKRNPTSYLFHNNRDGTFTDVTEKARLTRSGWGQACCVGDYDNDGFDDLFLTYFGRNVLYHNNGDGTFTDVSEQSGVAGSENRWGAGCCFLDYDRDGQLDLFVANYVNFDPTHAPKPGQSAYCMYNDIPVPCGPLGFAGGTNILYRNRGNGTFADVSQKAGVAGSEGRWGAGCCVVVCCGVDDDITRRVEKILRGWDVGPVFNGRRAGDRRVHRRCRVHGLGNPVMREQRAEVVVPNLVEWPLCGIVAVHD
jgi:hypothetical protein